MIKCTPNEKYIIYTKTFLYHHHELHFVVSMPIYIDTLSLFQVIMIYIYICALQEAMIIHYNDIYIYIHSVLHMLTAN